jgi:hypothetical protein
VGRELLDSVLIFRNGGHRPETAEGDDIVCRLRVSEVGGVTVGVGDWDVSASVYPIRVKGVNMSEG